VDTPQRIFQNLQHIDSFNEFLQRPGREQQRQPGLFFYIPKASHTKYGFVRRT